MWKVSELRDTEGEASFMYLHAFQLKRDAVAFAGRWRAANPGRWTRITKVGAA